MKWPDSFRYGFAALFLLAALALTVFPATAPAVMASTAAFNTIPTIYPKSHP